MNFPNFNQDQYVDADSLNAASAAISGSVASGMALTFYPGLISPSSATLAVSGLTLNSTLTAPFGVIFSSGVLAQAHGITAGADTQSYATSFSGVVPGSGSVTAYLVASYQSIQQTGLAIVGPPPGHPDYNPNFVPFTGYQNNVDSLALSATTTPPDNATTFEIARFTLAAGATGLPTPNTTFQQRFANVRHVQTITGAASGASITQTGKLYSLAGGTIYNLPPVSQSNDRVFYFAASTSGFSVVQIATGDTGVSIFGAQPSPAYPAQGVYLLKGMSCEIVASNGNWQVIAGSPWISMYRQLLTSSLDIYVATTGSDSLNTGLASGSPFLTLQKAWDTLQQGYDLGGNSATIHVANGTYNSGVICGGMPPGVKPGNAITGVAADQIIFLGNPGSPSAVTIAVTGANAIMAADGAEIMVNGFTLAATGAGGNYNSLGASLFAANYGTIVFQNITFAAARAQIHASEYGYVASAGNAYSITGGGDAHVQVNITGLVVIAGSTVTLTGTPLFNSAFVTVGGGSSSLLAAGMTFSGAASGLRYTVFDTSLINTNGGGANYFPGSNAGTADNTWNYR